MKKYFSIKKYRKYLPNKKYLPSKKFVTVFGAIILVLGLIFFISSFFDSIGTKNASNTENQASVNVKNQSVVDLLKSDTDSDGVYDWEEALWGTNKYKPDSFGGMPDLEYIKNKKKELEIAENTNELALTETDKFAREFFSTYTAMKDAGVIDNSTILNFSAALGNKITKAELTNEYTEGDIKTTKTDDLDSKQLYYKTVADLFAKYEAKGIGNEIAITSGGLEKYQKTEEPNSFEELILISRAYRDFASNVMNVAVPASIAKYHLRIANGAHKTGKSVENMAKVINDPLLGISGVSEYEKYSAELIEAVADLEATFGE